MCDQNQLLQLIANAAAQHRQNGQRNGQRQNGVNSNAFGQEILMAQMMMQAAQLQTQMFLAQQQQLQQQQNQQSSFQDAFKKLQAIGNKSAEKKAAANHDSHQPSTSGGATITIKEGAEIKLEAGEVPKPIKNTPTAPSANKPPVMDQAMWHLLANHLMMQQNALKATNGQRSTARKDHAAMDLTKTRTDPGTSSDGGETRSSATPSEHHEHGKKRPPATEAQARIPLQLGWRRQTCIRAIAPSGVRGDVVYYAPCGKKLSTYAEVLRYLMKNQCGPLTRDNFSFSSKLVVGEFIQPEERDDGEKVITKLSEAEITDRVNRLLLQRPPPKNGERRKEPRPNSPEENELDESFETPKGNYDDEEKIKWSREPIDDLLLTEIRPMPELHRIPNVELKGEGFADALMVFEFVKNFGSVLSIDENVVPTLEHLCAGLAGDVRYTAEVSRLTKVLFTLALEYPGLPSGKKGRTNLDQSITDIGVRKENYSELMRMFLFSRDDQGKKLSLLLDNDCFESLTGEQKASILGYLCNELLCCRNIVREIDGNLEEIGKLKGDRWLRDGKARALRTHQKRKKRESKTHNHHDDDGEDRPASRNSDSDGSRPGSPVHNNKKLTPGLGQVEILTAEEESMTAEELDVVIGRLNGEADELKDQINGLTQRVRAFPFGWDRFHRQYWQLPHVPTVLVESVESASLYNPACNMIEVCGKDPEAIEVDSFVHPDVIATMEDLIDDAVMMRLFPDKRKRKKVRRMENPCKRGWWMIESREHLDAVRSSLHGRGIRERCLHRLLCKNWFLKDVKLEHLEAIRVGETVQTSSITTDNRADLKRYISGFEQRVFTAQMTVPGWNPTSIEAPTIDAETDWSVQPSGADDIEPSIEDLKQRLLNCEQAIERRYLRQNFYAGETPSVARILGLTTKESEAEERDKEEREDDEPMEEEVEEKEEKEKKEEKEEEVLELMYRWRAYVAETNSTAGLMLAMQCLESAVAWERSITDAKCQICKLVGAADRLLLCDGCQMGYHLDCFKPQMLEVPSGEWFCPRCREQASGKPTCVLCNKEGAPIYPCRKCYNFCHIECSGQHTPDGPSDYVCMGCDTKNFARRVILRGESEERTEVEESVEPESRDVRRSAQKRKAEAPTPVVFPTDMNMDLCRTMLDEMEAQPSVGPFLEPVDPESVPGYSDVIANPIDISTIRNKVDSQCYDNPDDFAADIDLMFSNCRTFNEDDSPVGIAGQTLQKFFMKRWRQVKYNYSKRLRRMRPGN